MAEYAKVLAMSSDRRSLQRAHDTPCDVPQAFVLVWAACDRWQAPRPGPSDIRFTNRTGRCTGRTDGRATISLPSDPGPGQDKLRVGLVLHEAAHAIRWHSDRSMQHDESFTFVLDDLVRAHTKGALVR